MTIQLQVIIQGLLTETFKQGIFLKCNFLNNLYREYDEVDYVSIFICNRVRITSILWSLEFLFNP